MKIFIFSRHTDITLKQKENFKCNFELSNEGVNVSAKLFVGRYTFPSLEPPAGIIFDKTVGREWMDKLKELIEKHEFRRFAKLGPLAPAVKDDLMYGTTAYFMDGSSVGASGNVTKEVQDFCQDLIALLQEIDKTPHMNPDEVWDCKLCGQKNNSKGLCARCGNGKPSAPASWICSHCGQQNNLGEFCTECGKAKSYELKSLHMNVYGGMNRNAMFNVSFARTEKGVSLSGDLHGNEFVFQHQLDSSWLAELEQLAKKHKLWKFDGKKSATYGVYDAMSCTLAAKFLDGDTVSASGNGVIPGDIGAFTYDLRLLLEKIATQLATI